MRNWALVFIGLSLAVICAVGDTISGRFRVTPNLEHTATSGAATLKETLATLVSSDVSGTTGTTSMTKMWVKEVTFTGAQGTNFNLADSSLTDNFGQSVYFRRVKFFAVSSAATNFSTFSMGGAGSNPWTNWCGSGTDTVLFEPSSLMLIYAPTTNGIWVSNATSCVLGFTNTHASSNVSFNVYIGGIQE